MKSKICLLVALACVICWLPVLNGLSQSADNAVDSQSNDAKPLSTTGTVLQVKLDDKAYAKNLNGRLHFCLFESGDSDRLYAGTKYGMWSEGQFDLVVDGKVVFSGKVPHLLYGGALIDVGDVIDGQPRSGKGIYLTNLKGWVK